jgi:hypothetical protein
MILIGKVEGIFIFGKIIVIGDNLLNFAIHRHNEGVVTYGIRAGSTHDLGFAAAFVDMSGFYLLLLMMVL